MILNGYLDLGNKTVRNLHFIQVCLYAALGFIIITSRGNLCFFLLGGLQPSNYASHTCLGWSGQELFNLQTFLMK